MNRFIHIFLFFCALQASPAWAFQDTSKYKIDIRRVKLHEDIDKAQLQLAGMDMLNESAGSPNTDPDISLVLNDIFSRQTDIMQDTLERSATLDHRLKVKYLTGLSNLLREYRESWLKRTIPPEKGVLLFSQYTELMQQDRLGKSITPVVDKYPYETGNALIAPSGSVFFDNPGFRDARIILFRKFCVLHPEQALPRLESFPDVPFADSLIRRAAHENPNQFYDYAAASRTQVGQLIRRSEDPLVKAIAGMASSKSGRLYYPFLDEVVKGRQSIESIRAVMGDSLRYYSLLVQTQISYAQRLRSRDTPIAGNELTRMLKRKSEEVFINQINALHDEPDAIRFRILEPLNAKELYYLIVLGEEVIYTSSYKGVYRRMMEKTPSGAGDTLMMGVEFDRFKKFIKMAAGYNTLEQFLGTMPDSSAQRMMIAFARGLDKSEGLEEAVDVADSYGSITTPSVKKLIDREIAKSLSENRKKGNRRSVVIYDILQTIFASSSDSSVDISERLGIPPVYKLDYKRLSDASGKVVQLVFFYGDKDGMDSYANFMSMFNGRPEWKVSKLKEWVEIKSESGKPVWIFANLPLDNTRGDDPDARAQANLIRHLESRKLQPTVVIHRGHSYHVKYTINQLPESAMMVILGSCGGFHNLDDVLKQCPDAHIISSKEVGTRTVNEPLIRSINDDLRAGRNIEWIPLWKDLATRFPAGDARERFENYIPPHKNLGALFIKAYHKAMEGSGQRSVSLNSRN